ncbi:hypothetical protein PPACK8108_LOCUS4508 [Phakopsora pachyrhizi]|uniref:Uncharacterized protein n=1 Tax=Phakopsora pachyrhizi TaxID=170000 RepID=A0AAV0AP07_PHAPC|nr:hypothetical protein PPACK8108_LOCUS4508 [Phakopsora pachyrhizi]
MSPKDTNLPSQGQSLIEVWITDAVAEPLVSITSSGKDLSQTQEQSSVAPSLDWAELLLPRLNQCGTPSTTTALLHWIKTEATADATKSQNCYYHQPFEPTIQITDLNPLLLQSGPELCRCRLLTIVLSSWYGLSLLDCKIPMVESDFRLTLRLPSFGISNFCISLTPSVDEQLKEPL